jgi:ABC-type Mn2+/Zn2+ transport system ATPase subunit
MNSYVSTGVSEESNVVLDGHAIVIKNGTYAWQGAPEHAPTLSDVTLSVPKGSLCIVVGGAGSGKSSLLAAMLGEMVCMHGSTLSTGSVAYAAQVRKPVKK